MTKKEAKAHKEDWQQALAEGRVVRSNNGLTLTSYISAEIAEMFASVEGCEIVKPRIGTKAWQPY